MTITPKGSCCYGFTVSSLVQYKCYLTNTTDTLIKGHLYIYIYIYFVISALNIHHDNSCQSANSVISQRDFHLLHLYTRCVSCKFRVVITDVFSIIRDRLQYIINVCIVSVYEMWIYDDYMIIAVTTYIQVQLP